MTRTHNTSLATVFISVLALVFGLIGCDKDDGGVLGFGPNDEIIVDTKIDPATYLVLDTESNRLIFKSQEHFDDFMQYMSEIYTVHEELDAFETRLGFRSFRTYINDLRKELLDSPDQDSLAYFEEYHKIEALDIIEDPLFATMLNPAGEIQIGETLHKVGKSFVHSMDIIHENLLDEIDNYSDNALENPHVKVFHIKNNLDNTIADKIYTGADEESCSNKYYSNRYRVNGKSWIKSYNFYFSAGTETYHYKRTTFYGRYRQRNVNYIALTTTVNLYHSDSYGARYINYVDRVYGANERSNVFVIFLRGSYDNYGLHGSIDTYHHVRRSNGITAGCETDVGLSG